MKLFVPLLVLTAIYFYPMINASELHKPVHNLDQAAQQLTEVAHQMSANGNSTSAPTNLVRF